MFYYFTKEKFIFIYFYLSLSVFYCVANSAESVSLSSEFILPEKGKLTILFEGKDLRLEAALFGSENLWITFTAQSSKAGLGLNGKIDREMERFGHDSFIHREIDALYVVSYQNDWGYTEEMKTVLTIAQSIIKQSRYKNIITYGLSMGGYKALLFSERLGATMAFVFCPQTALEEVIKEHKANITDIVKGIMKGEQAHFLSEASKKYIKRLNLEDLSSMEISLPQVMKAIGLEEIFFRRKQLGSCKFLICYSEKNDFDKGQVDKLQGVYSQESDNLTLWPLPAGLHDSASVLSKVNFFPKIVELVNQGKIDEITKALERDGELWKAIEALGV